MVMRGGMVCSWPEIQNTITAKAQASLCENGGATRWDSVYYLWLNRLAAKCDLYGFFAPWGSVLNSLVINKLM